MRIFISRLLLFCLLPLPLLFVAARLTDSGLKRSHSFLFAEWNDIYSGSINADAIILGSSRAWVQFSPRILDTALGINSYNLGMDGASFEVQYERLKIYLKHNKKPECIIQETSVNTTFSKAEELPHYQQFLPYLDDSDIWNMIRHHYPSVGYLDRYFPLYKYNNELQLIAESISCYRGHIPKGTKYKGYEGMNKNWDGSFYLFKRDHPLGLTVIVDTPTVKLFKEYLVFCKANGIKVILVDPPTFIQSKNYIRNYNEILTMITTIAKENNVPLINYDNDSINYHKSNFYNSQHLNRTGAEQFTKKLAIEIKDYIHPAAH